MHKTVMGFRFPMRLCRAIYERAKELGDDVTATDVVRDILSRELLPTRESGRDDQKKKKRAKTAA